MAIGTSSPAGAHCARAMLWPTIGKGLGRVRRDLRGGRRQRAGRGRGAGAGRLASLCAGAKRRARGRHPDRRAHRSRVPPRRVQRVAPALHRVSCLREPRGRPGGAGPDLSEHRASDRDAAARRHVPAPVDRPPGERGGARRRCAGGRRRVVRGRRRAAGRRRPHARDPRDRAVVPPGPEPRAPGLAPQGLRRDARVRRRPAADGPHLAHPAVPLAGDPRPARPLGAARGGGARRRDVRLPAPRDRRGAGDGRHAGAPGRRRPARGRAGQADHRPRR